MRGAALVRDGVHKRDLDAEGMQPCKGKEGLAGRERQSAGLLVVRTSKRGTSLALCAAAEFAVRTCC